MPVARLKSYDATLILNVRDTVVRVEFTVADAEIVKLCSPVTTADVADRTLPENVNPDGNVDVTAYVTATVSSSVVAIKS
jgi:hypothetical protein